MANVLAVVEGAHDAAFLGRLLTEQGYACVEELSAVPAFWKPLIPTIFPNRGKLSHVVQYPDIYQDGASNAVAILVAGSVSKLISEVRATLEVISATEMHSVAVIADADESTAGSRFADLRTALNALNTVAAEEGLAGFPLTLPDTIGEFSQAAPRVGIYVLPDNVASGTLEALLLDSAKSQYPVLHKHALKVVADVDQEIAANDPILKKLRKGAGRQKAAAGTIANLLNPGASLAVSIARDQWLEPHSGNQTSLEAARTFVSKMLP